MGYSDIYHITTGAGFLPSTVPHNFRRFNIWVRTLWPPDPCFFAIGFPLPNSGSARCRRGRCISEFKLRFSQKILYGLSGSKMKVHTLQGTNVSPKNGILEMIFLFPRWDMLVPWRVSFCFWDLKNKVNHPQKLWLSFWDLKYRWVFTLKSFCWKLEISIDLSKTENLEIFTTIFFTGSVP